MTIFTHILVTTAGVQALGLHGEQAALAFAFGVAIDIDHVVKAPFYLKFAGLKEKKMGYYWRSSLQEPVGFLWIIPLSLYLGTFVPVLFYAMHLAMDYSVSFEKMPFYPYSNWVTRGWLLTVSDKLKEIIVFTAAVCTNSLLYWVAR
jgi:hypothetical protein